MIIGRAQDRVGVALFSRASGLVELFNRTVLRAVIPVCLPYFAKNNREQGSMVEGYLMSISCITVIGWPFLAFVGFIAYSAIRIVYGPQWSASVPLAQILCAAGAIELIHYLAMEALMAGGDVKRSNLLQIGLQASRVAGLFAVIPFGLTGACWGLLLAAAFGAGLSQWSLAHTIGLRTRDVVTNCLPSLYITALSTTPVALWAAVEGITEANFLRFALVGGGITATLWLLALRFFQHPLWQQGTALTKNLSAKYLARR
jgi:O-antigen/teichoic acid export membrane protein